MASLYDDTAWLAAHPSSADMPQGNSQAGPWLITSRSFGEPLRLPGQFLSLVDTEQATETVRRLNTAMSRLRPVPTVWHCRHEQHRPFVSPDLSIATNVFVRVNTHRPPLTSPYQAT